MGSVTQSIQQATQAVQVVNSFPSQGVVVAPEVENICTVQSNCFGAYVGVGISVAFIAYMVFYWTPLHSMYYKWRKNKKT